MEIAGRIERALEAAVQRADGGIAPPRIIAAVRHAVFPGGARVRPSLCLAVAGACGDDQPGLADAAACAIELMHGASLVHDDMPCFDDAATRRGKASVHAAFGAPLALLAGDAMIVLAFEQIAQAGFQAPRRLAALVGQLARATGLPGGIVAGQAWESEAEINLSHYHRAKTGALFVAATRMGALAAGADPTPWTAVGAKLGEAYQVADDLADAVGRAEDLGKPVGQDAAHARPNAVTALGVPGALARLESLLAEAIAAIPACPGDAALRDLVALQARRLTPRDLARSAA